MIGVFDSGIGGLSIVKELLNREKTSPMIYVADQAYLPYGSKAPQVIFDRAKKISEFLINSGCHSIVVACNTATVNAPISKLRSLYPGTVFVGVEPPVKPLSESGLNEKFLLVTEATCKSNHLNKLISRYGAFDIHIIPAIGLAESIESRKDVKPILSNLLKPIPSEKSVQIGLGCTHYSFIADLIKELKPLSKIIDVSKAVVKQIDKMYIYIYTDRKEGLRFITTGKDSNVFNSQLRHLLKFDSPVESVQI